MASLWTVPPLFVNKEDAIGQEEMNIDWSDKEQVLPQIVIVFLVPKSILYFQMTAMMAKMDLKMQEAYKKEPRMKFILGGNFLRVFRQVCGSDW